MKTFKVLELRDNPKLIRKAKKLASQGKSLNLTLDVVFKALFAGPSGDSHEALRSLLSACIKRPVRNLVVRNNEIGPEDLTGKTVNLDIHAAFNDGEEADIEMQAGIRDDDVKIRAVVYGSRMLSGQAKRGKQYREVKRVYQIFFVNGILFSNSEKVPRRYSVREETEYDQLSDVMEIIFYELPKLDGYVARYREGKEALKTLPLEVKWGIYLGYQGKEGVAGMIKELSRGEEGIMSAERELGRMSRDAEQWARALFREKAAMDYRSGMGNARDRGREEGIKLGLEQAHREKLESARKLREIGLSSTQIQETLGLSLAEIRKL
ncbi:MAG: Rpn family recombination-promoting nuclease/putative transposase [Treponema sp.]|nr:Rpn family recombination-promoting nuclease/putative transposase [Treponema sp.]